MQELLTFIVQHIAQHPEEVVVTEMVNEDGQHVTLRLSVHAEDMGLVIGREGSIARSLRNIMKVAAIKHNQRVYIDILEAGAESSEPTEAESTTDTAEA